MDLTPDLLIRAYSQGVFPMSHEGEIYWYDPDPRAILPLDGLHVSRSLQRTLKRVRVRNENGEERAFLPAVESFSQKPPFLVTVDQDFTAVIAACADPQREGSWIDDQILEAYTNLHHLGLAHSIEVWQAGELVGGLYGVSLLGLFAGESMFSRVTDASKVALAYTVSHLKERGLQLFDVQFYTPHLGRMGVIEIPRAEYKRRLAHALSVEVSF